MKDITGYWNIYECEDCDVVFAILQEKDQSEDVFCPHCREQASSEGNLWFETKH